MPKDQQKHELPRQTPVSCGFCRKRKLRCSREAPCSNCIARLIQCDLEHPLPQPNAGGSSTITESEIIERLNRLEKLLVTQKLGQPEQTSSQSPPVSQPQIHSPMVETLSPQIQGLANDVAWLESIYTSQSEVQSRIPSNQVVFRTCPVEQITESLVFAYTTHQSRSTRCILLPQYAEARILLDKYLNDVDHYHHVTHVPSLAPIIDEVYAGLHHQGQVKAGQVILLLGIFASATHCWVRHDSKSRGLFSCTADANQQAPLWVKACEDVLDIAHRSTSVSLEGIQGSIIAFFVIANIEGFSRRCRSFFSMSFFFARDLGLHRIDHPANAARANSLEAEIGRRIWWYLVTSEWIVAARFTGALECVYTCHPRQMITKKPLNVNDDEVYDGMDRMDRPLSQPTQMSYSLQRLRLGDICRGIVDRTPLISADRGGLSFDDIVDIDTQLQMHINEVPPFFALELSKVDLQQTYQLTPVQAENTLQQRYMLWFFLHAQRCKLHLPFFTRGFVDTSYSHSREICIKSARAIIRIEVENEQSGLCIATRFKFTGLLLGVFMASGVLLMDLCVNRTSPHHSKQRGEVAEAFRILDEAKNESEVAAKFVDSLMQILRKHKIPPPTTPSHTPHKLQTSQAFHHVKDDVKVPQSTPGAAGSALLGHANQTYGDNNDTQNMRCGTAMPPPPPITDENLDMGMAVDGPFDAEDLSSYFNELSQNFEEGLDVSFDWSTIFSSFETSSFV